MNSLTKSYENKTKKKEKEKLEIGSAILCVFYVLFYGALWLFCMGMILVPFLVLDFFVTRQESTGMDSFLVVMAPIVFGTRERPYLPLATLLGWFILAAITEMYGTAFERPKSTEGLGCLTLAAIIVIATVFWLAWH
jgi:hypothetical protein